MKFSWPLKTLLALCILLPLAYSTHSFDEFATPKMAFFLCGALILFPVILFYARGLRNLPPALWISAGFFLLVQAFQVFRLPYSVEGLMGAYGQSESLLAQLGFVTLFFAAYLWIKTDRERNAIFDTAIFSALLISIFGIFQYYLGDPITHEETARIKSLLGDPNSLGVYLMMVQPLLWWKALRETSLARRRFFLGCSFLQTVVLSLSFSRASWAGLGLAYLSFVFFDSRLHARDKAYWIGLAIVMGYGILNVILLPLAPLWLILLVGLAGFGWSLKKRLYSRPMYGVHSILLLLVLSLVAGQSLSALKPSSYKDYNLGARIDSLSQQQDSGRGLIWGIAWRAFKQAPWLGSGMGSFQDLFHHYETKNAINHWGPDRDIRQVHNELLHYLATQGILGCGAYLLLLMAILVLPLRTRIRTNQEMAALWSLLVGYLVFVQFAYPLVHYTHLFWIAAGILTGFYYPAPSYQPGPFPKRLAAGFALMVLVGMAFLANNFYRADVYYRKAFFQSRYRHFDRSLHNFQSALKLTPWSYQYRYRYAYTLIRAGVRTRNEILAERNFATAGTVLTGLRRNFPRRYQVCSMLGNLYFQQMDYSRAVRYYRQALLCFPMNYLSYYQIVRSELMQGHRQAALRAYLEGSRINAAAMHDLLHSDRLKLSLHPF